MKIMMIMMMIMVVDILHFQWRIVTVREGEREMCLSPSFVDDDDDGDDENVLQWKVG